MAFPYPAYEVPGSAPLTMMAAAILLEPWTRFRLSSPYPDPSTQSHHDEVPVDVVVNRLVLHLAAGTQGIVHAVSGPERRYASGALFAAMNKERRLFWKLKLSWRNVDWHTRDIHMVGRIYVVCGTSYEYREDRTIELAARLTEAQRQELPLYAQDSGFDLTTRRAALRTNVETILSKKGWPGWIAGIVCRS